MGPGFRHEALIYGDADEFLGCAVPFVRTALAAGEPVLVAVSDRNVGLLGRELGSLAAEVRFSAVGELARNPARLPRRARWRPGSRAGGTCVAGAQ
jgi:hypothetical protein